MAVCTIAILVIHKSQDQRKEVFCMVRAHVGHSDHMDNKCLMLIQKTDDYVALLIWIGGCETYSTFTSGDIIFFLPVFWDLFLCDFCGHPDITVVNVIVLVVLKGSKNDTMSWLLWIILRPYCQHFSLELFPTKEIVFTVCSGWSAITGTLFLFWKLTP